MKKALALFSCCWVLSACGISPEPSYSMLAPVDGVPDSTLAPTLVVTRPTLPNYLDRPGMVYQDDGGITIDDMHRWAAPLDTMLEDTLTTDLRQRLPQSLIQKHEDYLQPKDGLYVETEIDRFDTGRQGAILTAQIVIEDKHCQTRTVEPIAFHDPQGGEARDGLARLIGKLADRIVEIVRLKTNASCHPAS